MCEGRKGGVLNSSLWNHKCILEGCVWERWRDSILKKTEHRDLNVNCTSLKNSPTYKRLYRKQKNCRSYNRHKDSDTILSPARVLSRSLLPPPFLPEEEPSVSGGEAGTWKKERELGSVVLRLCFLHCVGLSCTLSLLPSIANGERRLGIGSRIGLVEKQAVVQWQPQRRKKRRASCSETGY